MTSRTLSIGLLAALIGACTSEGIDTGTTCQWHRPDPIWEQYDFDMDLIAPSERDCPLRLNAWGQSIYMSADVTAPIGTPESPLVWRAFDAKDLILTQGLANFGPGPGGRMLAKPQGYYQAGWQQDVSQNTNYVNQDQIRVDVNVIATSNTGVNRVYVPYSHLLNTPTIQASFSGLPRAKKGRSTTIRAVTNASPATYQWFRNGLAFTPPSNPWNIGGQNGTAYTFTPANTTPIDWKVVVTYGFPQKTKTDQWRQYIDP